MQTRPEDDSQRKLWPFMDLHMTQRGTSAVFAGSHSSRPSSLRAQRHDASVEQSVYEVARHDEEMVHRARPWPLRCDAQAGLTCCCGYL
jgi:hypothetical protein